MSSTLTCWKEIAEYLHKGVRTVQRWEQLGVPVRRSHGLAKSSVLAFTGEIDAWMRCHFEGGRQSELEILRKELAQVKRQNKLLRARLELAERAATVIRLNGNASVEHRAVDKVLLERAFHAIERGSAAVTHKAACVELTRVSFTCSRIGIVVRYVPQTVRRHRDPPRAATSRHRHLALSEVRKRGPSKLGLLFIKVVTKEKRPVTIGSAHPAGLA